MYVNSGRGLFNLEKYAQVTIEATRWDTYQLIASNNDTEEEVAVLGEYITKAKAEADLQKIIINLGKSHCVISLYDNWIPDNKGILGMDCMSI